MNDSRLLLQEFHTLLTEYHEKLPMTKMYRDSLIRRVEAELAAPTEERERIIEQCALVAENWGEPHCKAIAESIRALKRELPQEQP